MQGKIIRRYREKDFKKIPENKLIAIWKCGNNKTDLQSLEKMERHFKGEQFYRKKGEICFYCKGYTKVEMGRKLPDVPFCVTTRKTKPVGDKSKPINIYEIWIEEIVDPLLQYKKA